MDGQTVFQQKCVACHTIGEGKKIGPDLKGIAQRREIPWIKGFIQSPSSYFEKKDETAMGLLREYSIPMPDLGLPPDEVDAVVGYLTEAPSQTAGPTHTPPQYGVTLILAIGFLMVMTMIGLIAGRKNVEVRP